MSEISRQGEEHALWRGKGTRVFGSVENEGLSIWCLGGLCDGGENFVKSGREDVLEIWVNFEGEAELLAEGSELSVGGGTVVVFSRGALKRIPRSENAKFRVLALSMTRKWFLDSMGAASDCFGARLDGFIRQGAILMPGLSNLPALVRRAAEEMAAPPVPPALLGVWISAKAVEIATHVFSESAGTLFCERQRSLAHERVAAVKAILLRDVENPPSLAELGREVGCSPFYLSRIFSEETGTTIIRFLRSARLDLAAERLRSGRFNVTEAAMSVGYSSLSHFSKAFAERFGHCPCAFPLRPEVVPTRPGQGGKRRRGF